MKHSIKAILFLVLVVLSAIMLSACGSSEVTQNLSAEDRFELGKKKFLNEDYLEAINEFEIVKIQFPASSVADDAQFYLGECRYARGEFLLAAEEYESLKRSMPASPLVPDAQYKIAMCYYTLSPKPRLDQTNTLRAIEEFQAFIDYYPTHALAGEAASKIQELNTRLAKKDFESAELYMTLEYYKSATIYYTSVVEKYHDTPYAEPAHFGLVKAYVARRKYDEANQELKKFLERYPNSNFKEKLELLRTEINEHLKSKSTAVSPSQPSTSTR